MFTNLFKRMNPAPAECEPAPTEAEQKEMEEIEKIFKENPYAAADPEELDRLLNKDKRNRGKIATPNF